MDPRLVVVIGSKGVRLIRMVASSPKEEDAAVDLYKRLRKNLQSIDKSLKTEARSGVINEL